MGSSVGMMEKLVRIYSVFGIIPAHIGNLNFLNP
jgi:hypothetical protein